MNCCRETVKMGVPPGNRPSIPRDCTRGVPERYVAGYGTRGRPEGRPYPLSQQAIHETSGLGTEISWLLPQFTEKNQLQYLLVAPMAVHRPSRVDKTAALAGLPLDRIIGR